MIVSNCPARTDIMNFEFINNNYVETGIDTANYCLQHKKQCQKVEDCIIKQVIQKKGEFEYDDEQ